MAYFKSDCTTGITELQCLAPKDHTGTYSEKWKSKKSATIGTPRISWRLIQAYIGSLAPILRFRHPSDKSFLEVDMPGVEDVSAKGNPRKRIRWIMEDHLTNLTGHHAVSLSNICLVTARPSNGSLQVLFGAGAPWSRLQEEDWIMSNGAFYASHWILISKE